jgi:hypothetical protein
MMSEEPISNDNAIVSDDGATKRELITDTIKQMFKDPDFIESIAGKHRYKRPIQTSRNSNFSYYRATYATETRFVIDAMMEDGKMREWSYADFPELSKSTVYMRVYWSIRFLCDEMDPTNKYKEFIEKLYINRKCKTGVRLEVLVNPALGFNPRVVEQEKERTERWQHEVEAFIEDPTRKILHLKNLNLNEEQRANLEASFADTDGIIAIITAKEIKIIKDDGMVK